MKLLNTSTTTRAESIAGSKQATRKSARIVGRLLLSVAVLAGAHTVAAVRSPADDQHVSAPPGFERKNVMTMKDDLASGSPDIHWPTGFSPAEADLFSHNEGWINASCEQVWKHIVEAVEWPKWYPNSMDVQIQGGGTLLDANSVFTWTTFGLPLESKIHEFVPFSRIGWYGYSPGAAPSFYHTWFLSQSHTGCRVVTDEVGKGMVAKHLRETNEGLMHRGHDLWIATLKWKAESN